MATTRRSPYAELIEADLRAAGLDRYEPRHVEAWMRLEHSTLDALDGHSFRAEVITAVQCIDEVPIAESDALAESYGL